MGQRSTIAVAVGDVSGTASCYARLGLKVTGSSAARADVELPCGIHLLLVRRTAVSDVGPPPRQRRRPALATPRRRARTTTVLPTIR